LHRPPRLHSQETDHLGAATAFRFVDALGGRRKFRQLLGGAARARHELAAAVGAAALENAGPTVAAEGALERADHGVGRPGWQVAVAAFTVRTKLEHVRVPR